MSRSGTNQPTGRHEATNKVVVPAIDVGSSISCIRSLGRKGIPTIALASDEDAPSIRSKYCDEIHFAPSPKESVDGYLDGICDLTSRSDVLTVVPLSEADIYLLSRNKEMFEEHIATPWCSFERIRSAQDWLRLREVAESAGVKTPMTRLIDGWDSWDRPAVIKPRYSLLFQDGAVRYPDVEFVTAETEFDRDAIIEKMGHQPIVQEYIPGGPEYGFFALFDHGEPVAKFQHQRIRSCKYSGGMSSFRQSVDIPELEESGERLLRGLDWHGPAMVEFKRDTRDGTFKLIEVNPRFWGSLALPVRAGVNFPYLYYQLATGDSIRPIFDYEEVGCHTIQGEVSYLYSIFTHTDKFTDKPTVSSAISDLVTSFVRSPQFDYLDLDDPKPFIRQMLNISDDLFTLIGKQI